MSKLTEKEIRNILKVKMDTLTLLKLYEQEYIDILGNKGVRDLINQTLDEYIYWRKQLKKNEKE